MPKQRPVSRSATQFSATAAWDYGLLADHFRSPLTQAIFRGEDEISLAWAPTDGQSAHTVLRRTDGSRYGGSSIWASGTPQELSALVEAVLYSNAEFQALYTNIRSCSPLRESPVSTRPQIRFCPPPFARLATVWLQFLIPARLSAHRLDCLSWGAWDR